MIKRNWKKILKIPQKIEKVRTNLNYRNEKFQKISSSITFFGVVSLIARVCHNCIYLSIY
jgi:hypothetical protein